MNKSEWIEKLMQQYSKPMIRYAAAILKDTEAAREVVQECFLNLLEEPDGTVHLHLQGWLFRQCRNRAIDVWRKRQRQEPLDDTNDLPDFSSDPYKQLEQNRSLTVLQREVEKLSPRHQEVVWLKYHEGLSYKQISEIMGTSPSNVGFLLYEAVHRLRESAGLADTAKIVLPPRPVATALAAAAEAPKPPPLPGPPSADTSDHEIQESKRKW